MRNELIKFVKSRIPFENKGILVPVFCIGSLLISAFILNYLAEKEGGFFLRVDFEFTIGISLLLCSLITYLADKDYYKDDIGNKIKIDMKNSFFFIRLKYWVYIFIVLSVVCFAKSTALK